MHVLIAAALAFLHLQNIQALFFLFAFKKFVDQI